jgi:hypothetical protein
VTKEGLVARRNPRSPMVIAVLSTTSARSACRLPTPPVGAREAGLDGADHGEQQGQREIGPGRRGDERGEEDEHAV